jgi:hypothetical protein
MRDHSQYEMMINHGRFSTLTVLLLCLFYFSSHSCRAQEPLDLDHLLSLTLPSQWKQSSLTTLLPHLSKDVVVFQNTNIKYFFGHLKTTHLISNKDQDDAFNMLKQLCQQHFSDTTALLVSKELLSQCWWKKSLPDGEKTQQLSLFMVSPTHGKTAKQVFYLHTFGFQFPKNIDAKATKEIQLLIKGIHYKYKTNDKVSFIKKGL